MHLVTDFEQNNEATSNWFKISPAKTDSGKCVICKEVAKDDVLECSWCESLVHGDCIKISTSQSAVLSEIVSNVLFFCPSCMHKLPTALSCYDKTSEVQFAIDSKFSSMEKTFAIKIDSLSNQLKELEAKCLDNPVMETSKSSTTHSVTPYSSVTALSIADGLSDRERQMFQSISIHSLIKVSLLTSVKQYTT